MEQRLVRQLPRSVSAQREAEPMTPRSVRLTHVALRQQRLVRQTHSLLAAMHSALRRQH
jgi:hypothetical protein